MYKVVADDETFFQADDKRTKLLAVMTNLEFAKFHVNYIMEQMSTDSFTYQQKAITIASVMSYLYESLVTLDSLKREIRTQLPTEEEQQFIVEAWNNITSKKTTELKEGILRFIRNKSTFHLDPDVVENYNQMRSREEELILWENETIDFRFMQSFPIAGNLIIFWLLDRFGEDINTLTENAIKVLKDLNIVVYYFSLIWFDATLYEE